jgi:hypothetical protein
MSNIYLSVAETQDIINNLTPTEAMLYTTVKGMALEKPDASALKNPELAARLNIPEKTLINVKSSLKKKGYLVISSYKDANGAFRADVYIGKDQVELYNLGLTFAISDAKIYKELTKKFRFLDQSLSLEERKAEVEKANEYCLSLQK